MKHIPNILCICRILLIPFFVWQMIAGNYITAGILLTTSGLTDFLDGFLARRFQWISDLGKVLDPAADKLTQVTVCLTLIFISPSFMLGWLWTVFAFLLFKDALMGILAARMIKKGIKYEGSKIIGKISTCIFYVVVTILILFPQVPSWLVITLLSVTLVFAVISGFSYLPYYRRNMKHIKEHKNVAS